MTSSKDAVIHLLEASKSRRRHGNLFKLFCVLTAIGFILCFGLFGIWYSKPSAIYFFRHVLDDISPTCSGIPNVEKSDCYPEGAVSEERCLSRGCCYQAVSSSVPLGTPYCYYPSDFAGYSIQSINQNPRQMTIKLKRNFPSGFPKDVTFVLVVITFIDDNSLRIKIIDANSTRFEVPIPVNEDLKDLKAPLYTVTVDSKSNLIVTRKSSGIAIFNVNLPRLVYSDQFLQLSSRLPSPYLYGIGESYGPMLRNVNWTRITLFNSDRQPVPNYPLYGSQPFYLSLEPNGNANGVFLFNSNAMDVILQPTPAITFRPIGGILDFFIMLGPSPNNVVQQYTSIVGRTFMPPYWSLGFHLCRFGYMSLNKTRETMERNINAGIPIDVQWNDIDYMNRYKDFTFDEVNFAGLPEFVDELHKMGMHYVIMTDPGLSNSEKPGTYPPYDEGVKDDIFMKNPNGSIFVGKVWTDGNTVFPDFSHPNSTAYWSRQFANFHDKVKFDGVWIDMNEPSNFVDGGIDGCEESPLEEPPYLPGTGEYKLRHKTACMTAKHFKTVHYNEHNLLGYREAAATYQALKSVRNKRPFIISRASFAGQGVHSGHWSGDIASTWEDMRYTIPSTINFNIYGVSMIGSDICGFNRNTTVELCARWQALGAFYPFSRNHNERVTIEQDPVALGPTVVEATRNALNLRYLLLPYLYTLFYRSHVFGDTVVRPTFFEFPEDKNTYAQDEQFLWGPAVMIIPALYPNMSSVTAYMPKGVWYQGSPIRIISPGQKYSFPSDITNIVTSIRGGHIIPIQFSAATTTKSRKNDFVLSVALDQNFEAHGELYWDDGDSLDSYENGKYNLIEFSTSKGVLKNNVIKSGYKDVMNLSIVEVAGVNPLPKEVTFNGIQCLKRADITETIADNSPLMRSPWFAASYNHNLTAYETCVFTVFPPIDVAISFKPTSLLTPFEITWK